MAKELLVSGSAVALVAPDPPETAEIAEDTLHIPGNADSLAEKSAEIAAFRADTVIHLSARHTSHVEALNGLFKDGLEQVIVASSANVYKANGLVFQSELGDLDNTPISEKSLLREKPLNEEGSPDRLDLERALAKSPLTTTIFRLPPVYGPGDPYYRLLPLMSRMIEKRPFVILAESQSSWRWTHAYVADVVHGFAQAAKRPDSANRIFNIGEKKAPTIMERIRHLATIIGWEGDLVSLPDDEVPAHILPVGNFDQNLELDTSKIRKEIEYKEVTDYYDGLNDSIQWYKANLPPLYRDANFNYESEDALKDRVAQALGSA